MSKTGPMRPFEKQYSKEGEAMLGSKIAVGCSKGKVTLRFLSKGTGCGVKSEVTHGGRELRERQSLMGRIDQKKKSSQRSELEVFFIH